MAVLTQRNNLWLREAFLNQSHRNVTTTFSVLEQLKNIVISKLEPHFLTVPTQMSSLILWPRFTAIISVHVRNCKYQTFFSQRPHRVRRNLLFSDVGEGISYLFVNRFSRNLLVVLAKSAFSRLRICLLVFRQGFSRTSHFLLSKRGREGLYAVSSVRRNREKANLYVVVVVHLDGAILEYDGCARDPRHARTIFQISLSTVAVGDPSTDGSRLSIDIEGRKKGKQKRADVV